MMSKHPGMDNPKPSQSRCAVFHRSPRGRLSSLVFGALPIARRKLITKRKKARKKVQNAEQSGPGLEGFCETPRNSNFKNAGICFA
jgi:hypothetical protein